MELQDEIAERLAKFVGYKQGLIAMPKDRKQKFLDEADQILSLCYADVARDLREKACVIEVYGKPTRDKNGIYLLRKTATEYEGKGGK